MTDYRTVPDRTDALRVGRAILDAHGQWEKENTMRGSQDLWGEQHVILLGQAAMLAAAPALSAPPAPAGDLVERDIAVIRDMVSDYAGNEQWDAWSRIQNEMARLRALIAAMQPVDIETMRALVAADDLRRLGCEVPKQKKPRPSPPGVGG